MANVSLGLLTILVIGFISSSINRIWFNAGVSQNYQDLSTLLTKTSYEKKTGHKIEIEIWNGCGISNLAMMYTDFLRTQGFDILESKNAANFDYSNTTIISHRGDLKRALELANVLQINSSNIINDKNENLFYDLTLIIGKDYKNLGSYRNAVLFQPPY